MPAVLGDCLTCDGYVINESEAPYCPSCTRQRRLAAKDELTIAPTRYMLRLKLKATGGVSEHAFDSMTERNLFVFTLGPWADVEREWTA